MPRLSLVLLATLAAPLALAAQQGHPPAAPPPAAAPAPADTGAAGPVVINGFVLDSMSNLPLSGATVVMVGTTHQATTDAGGRFHFVLDTVPDGVYTLGFFHPTLDSLGITPPTQRVEARRGSPVFVQLAVPSMRTILRFVCPDSTVAAGNGVVMGVVRDAATDAPLASARVVVMWTGLSFSTGEALKVPKAVSALTSQDGSYKACGVPTGGSVSAQAHGKTANSGWIQIDVPLGGVALRDFLIGTRPPVVARTDTGGPPPPPAPLGTAVLVGTVHGTNGKPLPAAQVMLLGTRLITRTNEDGKFRLTGLPAGTQSVEVREIGYGPRRFAVDLLPAKETRLAAVLDERATVLKAIEVTARKGSNLPGFESRRKMGMGTYLTETDIKERQPIAFTDIFRGLPGVQVMWDGSEYLIQMSRASNTGMQCPVQWYIDGAPFMASGSDMDAVLQPDQIVGIEVYKGPSETPPQFQGADGGNCGTIVVWTKRGGARKPGSGSNP
jgi:hypothetical protein